MGNGSIERSNKSKQHVTPKFYLDFFSFDESKRKPHIWVHDKITGEFFSDSTDNVGYVKNIYTLNAAKNKYAWDDFYTYIVEPKMAEIFKYTVATASSMIIKNGIDIISAKQKAEMAMFIAAQITRGEKFIGFADSAYDMPSELIKDYTGVVVGDNYDNKRIDIAELVTGRSLLSICTLFVHNRSWVFYYSREEVFITSDEPVVFFNDIGNKQGVFECGLADSRTVICMPLNPKLLLVMYHPMFRAGKANAYDKKRLIIDDIHGLIQRHNTGQISQSKRFVYGKSEKTIKLHL